MDRYVAKYDTAQSLILSSASSPRRCRTARTGAWATALTGSVSGAEDVVSMAHASTSDSTLSFDHKKNRDVIAEYDMEYAIE